MILWWRSRLLEDQGGLMIEAAEALLLLQVELFTICLRRASAILFRQRFEAYSVALVVHDDSRLLEVFVVTILARGLFA